MIEKAMQESLHYSVNLNKNAKQQALEVIRLLQESGIMPIAPAQMRIRLIMPAKDGKRLKDKLLPMLASVEEEDWNEEYELVSFGERKSGRRQCGGVISWQLHLLQIALIEPGKFRDINTIIQDDTKGKGQLEVLSVSETNQTEEEL